MNIVDNIDNVNTVDNTPAPEPAALPAAPRRRPAFSPRRPTGKVARLPLEIRNLVNFALRDGRPYTEIIALLAAHGFTGVTAGNLSTWAKGGYAKWLDAQERFESARALSPQAVALLGQLQPEGRSEVADLNESLLAFHFNALLDSVDASGVRQDPQQFVSLARALTGYMAARAQRQRVELERLKYELDLRKIADQKEKNAKPRGLSPATIRQIEAAAKML